MIPGQDDAGRLRGLETWPDPVYSAAPCRCHSCDNGCGGTVHPDSCGPLELGADGHQHCQACREIADVWDGDHGHAKVRAGRDGDTVELAVNPLHTFRSNTLRLTPAAAAHLGTLLILGALDAGLEIPGGA